MLVLYLLVCLELLAVDLQNPQIFVSMDISSDANQFGFRERIMNNMIKLRIAK